MVATCLVSAIPSILMAFLANYPIACAPGMGHNAIFAFWVCSTAPGGLGLPWQAGLACVFLSGVLFLLLSGVGFREAIIDAIPESLKHAIAVGIGLFITLIGLEWGGIIVASDATLLTLAHTTLASKPTLTCLFGLLVTLCLLAMGVRAAILLGLLASGLLGIALGVTKFQGILALPPSLAPTAFKLDFAPLLAWVFKASSSCSSCFCWMSLTPLAPSSASAHKRVCCATVNCLAPAKPSSAMPSGRRWRDCSAVPLSRLTLKVRRAFKQVDGRG